MDIEPSPAPDGSCSVWHYYFQGSLVASLERVSARKWNVITLDGREIAHERRKDAVEDIWERRLRHAH